jgi:hypothetical protein
MRRGITQQQHEQERADDGKAENHEGVDISEHVSLILHRSREQSGCACCSFRVANGAARDDFCIIL